MNKINLHRFLTLTFWLAVFSLTVFGQTYNCSDEDFDCKIQSATKAIQSEPKNADNYLIRANAYDDLGKTEEAIKDYNQAISLKPEYALAFINRGIAYGRQGKYNQAVEDFSSAIKLSSEYSDVAYKSRAAAYDKLGETAKAEADRRKYEGLSNSQSDYSETTQTTQNSDLKDTVQAKYKVGQMWSYKTRAGEESSYLIIVKVENHPQLGNIIHIALMNLKMKRSNGAGAIIESAAHLPFSENAINLSVLKLLKDKTDLPNYQEGYNLWREAFDAHKAGIYTIPVAKAIDEMETVINQ